MQTNDIAVVACDLEEFLEHRLTLDDDVQIRCALAAEFDIKLVCITEDL